MILIVDDSSRVRSALTDLFVGEGHEVKVAASRRSAEALLERERFVFAVIDYEIPLEDRPSSLPSTAQGRAVMEAACSAKVPFVVLTGVAYSWHEAFAARQAVDYLDKSSPFHERLLEHAAAAAAAPATFPLSLPHYSDGRVQLLREESWVRVWVRGSRSRETVRVPRSIATALYHMASAQADKATCGFQYLARANSRRGAARDLRRWLQEHFSPSLPPERDTSPVVADRARGGYYCEVQIRDEPDPEVEQLRRAALREAGEQLEYDEEDDD